MPKAESWSRGSACQRGGEDRRAKLSGFRREIGQHARVLQDEVDLGILLDQACAVAHLSRKNLQVEGESVILQASDILPDPGIKNLIGRGRKAVLRRLMPMNLHTDTAN